MEQTNNNVLTLIGFLLNHDRRQQVAHYIKNLRLPQPYNIVLDTINQIDGDITPSDLRVLLQDKLNDVFLQRLDDVPADVSIAVGYHAIGNLLAVNKLDKISKIFKSDTTASDKVNKIQLVVSQTIEARTSQAIPISELSDSEYITDVNILGYNVGYGELILLAGYTGSGKTNLSLSLIRDMKFQQQEVLFVSILDWTEQRLKEKIVTTDSFPDFYVTVTTSYSIAGLEMDIMACHPKVVIVDALTNLDAPDLEGKQFEKHGWRAKELARVAKQYNIVIICTHQLTNFVRFPQPVDLQDSKSHLLSHCDLALGIGGLTDSNKRNLTELKLRHHESLGRRKIEIDFKNLRWQYAE